MDLLTGCLTVVCLGCVALAGYAVRRLADAVKALAAKLAELAIRRPLIVVDQTNEELPLADKAATLEGRQERVVVQRGGGPRPPGPARPPLADPPPDPDSEDGWEGAERLATLKGG